MDDLSGYKKRFVVEEAKSLLVPENKKEEGVSRSFKARKIGFKVFSKRGIFIVFLLLIFFPLLVEGYFVYKVYQEGIKLRFLVNEAINSVKAKDLNILEANLSNINKQLISFKSSFDKIYWLRFIPKVGIYVEDLGHAINAGFYGIDLSNLLIEIVEPYSDVIGFNNSNLKETKASNSQTAQDKLDFVIKTLPSLISNADKVVEKMDLIKNEIDYINYEDYPDKLFHYEIKTTVSKIVEVSDFIGKSLKNAKPLLEVMPFILGIDDERTYLVLFQNDKELRPTGGFMTAYSIAKVRNGRFDPTISNDIYNLDDNYKPSKVAPDPIIKYLKGPYLLSNKLRLRDMNWSPDFSQSMKLFSQEIAKAGIVNIDGIISVDTQVLVDVLEVLGAVNVPGYGRFSNDVIPECNCPQVIYELESFADIEGPIVWSENEPDKIVYAPPNYDNRKKIIGPLMNSILSASLGLSNEKIPALFEAGMRALMEKHILVFLKDEKAQKAIESFGIGGTIKDYAGDYLYINDANLGGRKSNLYVKQEVFQEIEVDKEGNVIKTLVVTYKNPEKHDGWLNSVLPNWVRIYVPKGSELISISGLGEKSDPYEEFGKTVFAGFFELRPQGVVKLSVKYKLPFKIGDDYSLFIQKQPGKGPIVYSVKLGKDEREMVIKEDKKISLKVR